MTNNFQNGNSSKLPSELDALMSELESHKAAHWYMVGRNNKAESLLRRCIGRCEALGDFSLANEIRAYFTPRANLAPQASGERSERRLSEMVRAI